MEKSERKEEIIKIVLQRISEGESLRAILPIGNDLISREYFNQWLHEDTTLVDRYTHAREERADKIFEDIIDIADNKENDISISENGVVLNSEFVQRSKLKIDARKWMLSKMLPKKYGDKLDIDHTTKGEEVKQVFIIGGKTIEF